eukprot:gene17306-biopygen6833
MPTLVLRPPALLPGRGHPGSNAYIRVRSNPFDLRPPRISAALGRCPTRACASLGIPVPRGKRAGGPRKNFGRDLSDGRFFWFNNGVLMRHWQSPGLRISSPPLVLGKALISGKIGRHSHLVGTAREEPPVRIPELRNNCVTWGRFLARSGRFLGGKLRS